MICLLGPRRPLECGARCLSGNPDVPEVRLSTPEALDVHVQVQAADRVHDEVPDDVSLQHRGVEAVPCRQEVRVLRRQQLLRIRLERAVPGNSRDCFMPSWDAVSEGCRRGMLREEGGPNISYSSEPWSRTCIPNCCNAVCKRRATRRGKPAFRPLPPPDTLVHRLRRLDAGHAGSAQALAPTA